MDEREIEAAARGGLQRILDMGCPPGRAGDALAAAQRIASETITELNDRVRDARGDEETGRLHAGTGSDRIFMHSTHQRPMAGCRLCEAEAVQSPQSEDHEARGFWREVPCGHPPDPIAVRSLDGHWCCHCGRILDPADAHSHPPEAPGPVVQCGKCGCHVAVPVSSPQDEDHEAKVDALRRSADEMAASPVTRNEMQALQDKDHEAERKRLADDNLRRVDAWNAAAVSPSRVSSVAVEDSDLRVETVIAALLSGESVKVRTATREFEGRVWEVGRSPYDDSVRARVADPRGYVHYFRVNRPDTTVEFSRSSTDRPEQPEPDVLGGQAV